MNDEIKLGDAPSIYWKRYFEKFPEIDTLPTNEWSVVHLISYFCRKYKAYYNSDFQFKFNVPQPSKAFEPFQIRKLSNLLSSDPKILKEYIDWCWDNIVPKRKRKITTISFLTDINTVNEYKNIYLTQDTAIIDRARKLPDNYSSIAKEMGIELSTYGDLAFLLMAGAHKDLVIRLCESGMDVKIVDRIK